ncbi:MAG: FliA/WhiG family RNA polymerase sigma factor [Thermodesulfobacteriota bacterium]|nr:FliA/WhiG family RNA polymerase sigma factor [Thermodesulfobacteriota bacterium]
MKAYINKYQEVAQSNRHKADATTKEGLILKYAPLVKYIVDRMALKLPSNISKEELSSAGAIGLLDAIDKFKPEMGPKFETYAEHRIKGAILDELRKMDWVSRSIRKDIQRIENAISELRFTLKRDPDDLEIAQELGIDIESYYKMSSRAWGIRLLSLDELFPDGSAPKCSKQISDMPSPFDELKIKELKENISHALSGLANKEQLVMSLYYYDELTLKEIAEVLSLTESRISQIHSKAITKLRIKLTPYNKS